jgi:hypothetical protein
MLAACSSDNHFLGSSGFHRQVGDGVPPGNESATILQFIHGLRGSLHVTFEEGTCAA